MSPEEAGVRNRRVGARIRRQRQVLGWNQRDLAERVGVHVGSVQKWEAGTYYPGRKLGKIEAVLGIDLDDENGIPGEPEIPQTVLDSLDRVVPEGDPYRDGVIDMLKQALKQQALTGNTGPMPAVPPVEGPGRHRRRASG